MRTRSKLSILLSILLCCTMLAGLLPTVAFAEDGTTVSSENGADTSPEKGTAAPLAAPPRCAPGCAFRCMDWGNRIPDIGGGGKCRCKR